MVGIQEEREKVEETASKWQRTSSFLHDAITLQANPQPKYLYSQHSQQEFVNSNKNGERWWKGMSVGTKIETEWIVSGISALDCFMIISFPSI